jgi:hypothetical protein
VTGFEFPRKRTPRGMLDIPRAETSLPVTIFPSHDNSEMYSPKTPAYPAPNYALAQLS